MVDNHIINIRSFLGIKLPALPNGLETEDEIDPHQPRPTAISNNSIRAAPPISNHPPARARYNGIDPDQRKSAASSQGYIAESEWSYSRPGTHHDDVPPLPDVSDAVLANMGRFKELRERKNTGSSAGSPMPANGTLSPMSATHHHQRYRPTQISTTSTNSSLPDPPPNVRLPRHHQLRSPTMSSFTTASFGSFRTDEDGGATTDAGHKRSGHPYSYMGECGGEPQQGQLGQSSSRLTVPNAAASNRTLGAESTGQDSGLTLASMYLVCGLPKDPQCWTLAQPESLPSHLEGAVPRFWRPEVLGTTVSGQDADLLASDLDTIRHRTRSRASDKGKKSQNKNRLQPQTSATELADSKEQLARVQAKAMKLAFPREVEVIASTVQPPSTTHCFSFVIPPVSASVTDATGAVGQEWDLALAGAAGTTTRGKDKTHYGACLTVWSHADRSRSEAIRKTVEEGSRSKSKAIASAVRAAAAGRKFNSRLQQAARSPMGSLPSPGGLAGKNWGGGAGSTSGETDTETEGFYSESEWEGPAATMPVAQLPGGTPFWLPYSLVLVSRFPVFDLMTDHLRISWARFHTQIGKHSMQMLKMLNFPAPKGGLDVKFPVGAGDSQTYFVTKMPGKSNLINAAIEDVDFTMWPVFKCLSLEHVISIYEIAFSPMGRVVFFSRYPVLLNIAVETFRNLLELRGWKGMVQSVVHARDVKIYLEDPGPYLLGMNSQIRPIASSPPLEVMVVDLDTNSVQCANPHPHALSKGGVRMKLERKLQEALGTFGGVRGVPSEFHEAFPGGRFRPFSQVEIKGQPMAAERLVPPPEWSWNQARVVSAFDSILAEVPRRGLAKMFRRRSYRQPPTLDASALHVQEIVRRHASGFVDRRDMLETKIWKLNRRLTFLMSESMEWKTHFDTFQRFTDRLSIESQDLKTRLEMERRDHKKLSGVVTEQKVKQTELEHRLLETEQAWMSAQVELAKAQEIREELERQKDIMVSEMKSIALGSEDIGDISSHLLGLGDIPSRPGTAASNHASLTTRNLRRLSTQSRVTGRAPSMPSTFANEDDISERGISDAESESDEVIKEATNRVAVIDTMRGIQARLEAALRSAGQLDEEELQSYNVGPAGNARSRLSVDSYDSKVVRLSRGRRKPTPPPSGPSSAPDHDESVRHGQRPSLVSLDSGIPSSPDMPSGSLRKRGEMRLSAVPMLAPGKSIFDRRDKSESPRLGSINKLPTVVDEDNGREGSSSPSYDSGRDLASAMSAYDEAGDSASFVSAESYSRSNSPLPPSSSDEDTDPLPPHVRSRLAVQSSQSSVAARHSFISVASDATARAGPEKRHVSANTIARPPRRTPVRP